jgi:hypothetical protein
MSIDPDELRARINADTERRLMAEHADLEAKIRAVLIDKIATTMTAELDRQSKSGLLMDMRALATVAVDQIAEFAKTHSIADGEVVEL